MKKRFLALIAFLFCASLFAEYNRVGVSDSSEIRKKLIETWFCAPLAEVRNKTPEIRENDVGEKFQIYTEETDKHIAIYVSPQAKMNMDVYSDKGVERQVYDIYPPDAEGSWVLFRDKRTGEPDFIRFHTCQESDIYIEFKCSKKGEKAAEGIKKGLAFANLICYNLYIRYGVPLGLPFERFYDASLSEIKQWTTQTLPWDYISVHTDAYVDTMQMIGMIREKLPSIIYTPDAMYDENGNSVYLSTGKLRTNDKKVEGCIYVDGAGFLKWISDGITEPLTGSKLNRTPLLTQTVHYKETGYQGIVGSNFNISFTLDWIRNLSSAIISIRTEKNYMYNESGCDVTISPFAQLKTEKGIQNAPAYIADTGYKVDILKALMYVLAVSESDTFYFGAISVIDKKTPELKVFSESCVIFPYFDSKEHFKCALFKDGKEMTLDNFCKEFKGNFISLTRVRATKKFFP